MAESRELRGRGGPPTSVRIGVLAFALALLAGILQPAGAIEHPLGPERVSGTLSAFGAARDLGPGGDELQNVAAMASTPNGDGYWVASLDGSVTAFGAARHRGDASNIALRSPVIDIESSPTGRGYWLIASDGGVFAFGDAPYLGSVPEVLPPGAELERPVVAMASSASGRGYWIVAADGGVFTFGDAPYLGSVPAQLGPGRSLAGAITGLARTPNNRGYWLAGDDGGVFTFGAATYLGSAANQDHPSTVVSIAAAGGGYLLAYRDGDVAPFSAEHHGDAQNLPGALTSPVVAIESNPTGGYWLLYGSASELAPGSRGGDVLALQHRLTSLGYWLGDPDASYGGLTTQAVMAFQKWVGLPRTGAADRDTLNRLAVATRPRPATTDAADLIELDIDRQVILVVRGGETAWAFNTSTGSEVPYQYNGRWFHAKTPLGRYKINFERPVGWRISHLGALWRPKYFNGGIAFHGARSVPAYPASHGCSRLSIPAMDFFYSADLAPIGSQVWVYRSA